MATTPPPASWSTAPWLRALLILGATLLAYRLALDAGFIWDDDDYVSQNPLLRDATGLLRIWFEPTELPQYYPLVHTTFWLEFRWFGMDPTGYHWTNVLLHAGNAVLLRTAVARAGIPGATLAAVLFALHPVHVESVAWITERKNVLSATCYLGALLLWQRWAATPPGAGRGPTLLRPVGLWAGSFLLFLGALWSKTVTCSLPAAFLLLAFWRHARLPRREVLASLPFFAVGFALAMVTAALERSHVRAEGADFAFSFADRLLIAGRAVWFYLQKLCWPWPLSFNYERWQIDAGSLLQWIFPAAAAALVVGLTLLRRRIGRAPLVAALFFGGTLVPALGFFNVFPMRYSFVADHFQYLASLGPIVLAAAAIDHGCQRLAPQLRRAAWAVVAAWVGVLAWTTHEQCRIYQSAEAVWVDTIARNPDSWLARTNLGGIQLARGELDAALANLRAALRIKSAPEVHTALGLAEQRSGNAEAALHHLRTAVALDPRHNSSKAFLAGLLIERGELDEAERLLQDALAIRSDYDRAQFHLGELRHRQGRHAEALVHLEQAMALNPLAADAYGVAASAASALGQHSRALTLAANALQRSDDPRTRAILVAVAVPTLAALTPEHAARVVRELARKLGPAGAALGQPLLERLRAAGHAAHADAIQRALGN